MKRGLAILLATTLSTTAWGWEYDTKHHDKDFKPPKHHYVEHHKVMPHHHMYGHDMHHHYPMHHHMYVHHMHMPPPPPKPPVVPPTPPAPTPPTASTPPTSTPPAQQHVQAPRHGSTVGVWIAGGMVGCGTLSLMIGAAYVAKTQHRELTTQEANELVFGCILPILGPALVDNYYATHRK